MVMLKRIYALFGGRRWLIAVVFLSSVGAFLRLFRILETTTFLGDQGRDAIIMKSIVTLQNLPALGPITSVGSIYLGPLYYYLMSPWLLLFGFDPIGPSVGVAIIASLALLLQYFAIKDTINKETALISVIFSTFSWALVEYSRFSWNPNLLPQVALFSVYTLFKAVETKKLRYFIFHGLLLSLAVQLHYLAIFLLPLTAGVLLYQLVIAKKLIKQYFIKLFALITSFSLALSPFILFEFIHSFPNIKSVLRFSQENTAANTTPFFDELSNSLLSSFRYAFQFNPHSNFTFVLTLILLALFVYGLKKKRSIAYVVGSFFILIVGVSLYRGPKYTHYLGGTYLLLYVSLGYLMARIIKSNRIFGLALSALIIIFYISMQIPKYYFLFDKEYQFQTDRARTIAGMVISLDPQLPYTFTSSPEAYADYPARYFLNVMGKKPIDKEQDAYVPTKELFVFCDKDCNPMDDPQWAIAHFNPKKITNIKTNSKYPEFKVYKLTR